MVASARPVQVKVTPGETIDFRCCVSGKSVSKDIEVSNHILDVAVMELFFA